MTNRQCTHTDQLIARLGEVRMDWTLPEVRELFALPFADLLFHAQRVHRANFDPNEVQVSTLLSIKTGACPEDCAYCSQSIRFETGLKSEPLLDLQEVVEKARIARANGATRFCMGAAYRSPKPKQLAQIAEMVRAVRALGMETCATLGMLTPEQARELKNAGLDYYNHNLDTSENHYGKVITTRTYQDRLDTLQAVRDAGLNVCCGGILGLGENELDRAQLLAEIELALMLLDLHLGLALHIFHDAGARDLALEAAEDEADALFDVEPLNDFVLVGDPEVHVGGREVGEATGVGHVDLEDLWNLIRDAVHHLGE